MVTSMVLMMGLVAKLGAAPGMRTAFVFPDVEAAETPASGFHELDRNDGGAAAMFRELNSGTGRRESGTDRANLKSAFSR